MHGFRGKIPVTLTLLLLPALARAQALHESNHDSVTRPDGTADIAKVTELIVERTNKFRKSQGLSPVEPNDELTDTARYFAEYMAETDEYGHEADGKEPADRAAEHGYELCIVSENIAWQFSSVGFETEDLARRLVTGWRESPPHRKNMVDADVTQTGVAVAQSEETGRYYAVQMFGRPKSLQFEFKIVNESNLSVEYDLGDEAFGLPPRYIRTHQRCRPTRLVFLREDDEVARFTPERGDAFTVRARGANGYTVTKSAEAAGAAAPQQRRRGVGR